MKCVNLLIRRRVPRLRHTRGGLEGTGIEFHQSLKKSARDIELRHAGYPMRVQVLGFRAVSEDEDVLRVEPFAGGRGKRGGKKEGKKN